MADVVVRLSERQRALVRSAVAMVEEHPGDYGHSAGESAALSRALDAIDNATPVLTEAQSSALTSARALADAEWEDEGGAGLRRTRTMEDGWAKVYRAMRP